MPDDVKSVVADSPTKVTITFTGPANPYWFTYNELSQITPFPMAWDVTAAGQRAGAGCAARLPTRVTVKLVKSKKGRRSLPVSVRQVVRGRVRVPVARVRVRPEEPEGGEELAEDIRDEPDLAGRRRPWHLTSFDSSGNIAMAPNQTYRAL